MTTDTSPEAVERLLEKMTFEVVNSEMDRGLASEIGSALRALSAENERLRTALKEIRDSYGPNHLSGFARDTATAALQEKPHD